MKTPADFEGAPPSDSRFLQPKLVRTLLNREPAKKSFMISALTLALLVLIFTLDHQFAGTDLAVYNTFSASKYRVFEQHEYWRLFTSTLLHGDLGHLLANSVFFTGLGFLLNAYFGVWAFPVISFLAGGLVNFLILPTYPSHVSVIGASGIVYFMASFWLVLYYFVERRHSATRRVMNTLALALVLFVPSVLEERVSYIAHAAGFALGLPMGALFFLATRDRIRSFEHWKTPVLEPVMQEDIILDEGRDFEKVVEILPADSPLRSPNAMQPKPQCSACS